MQTALPADFKRGMVLLLDGAPHLVEELHVSGTAKTKHKLHVQVRNLQNGHVFERVFPDNERVPTTELEHRRVSFSYVQGGDYANGGAGRTLVWTGLDNSTDFLVTETYRDELHRSDKVRVRTHTAEKVINPAAGTLITTGFAA